MLRNITFLFLLFQIGPLFGFAQGTSKSATSVRPIKTWTLPPELKDISGISYVDPERIACVQDEAGIIYVYNLTTNTIEAETQFASAGDYEGIALVDKSAYIAVADGRIIEVLDYRSGRPSIKEYGTHLTAKENPEGICYDRKNNRLLVAIKGNEPATVAYKGIYEFNLATKTLSVNPVIKIDLQDSLLRTSASRKQQSVVFPSEIEIHPQTGDIYITDAVRSQLIIMSAGGQIKWVCPLEKETFYQPEGIMFTPSGEVYIASEGGRQRPATISSVQIDK